MYHHTFHSKAAAPTMSMPGMKMNSMPGMNMSDMPGMDRHSAQQGSTTQAPPPMQMVPDPRIDLATTFLWGRARSLPNSVSQDNSKENSYLAEALLRFASTNYVWTRLENAGRSNELLLTPGTPLPPTFIEAPIGHVAAYTFGYDHDLPFGRHLLIAPGAQLTIYRTPEPLRPIYGNTPTAETLFIRFRLR
jgi:hypothetical protein